MKLEEKEKNFKHVNEKSHPCKQDKLNINSAENIRIFHRALYTERIN